MSMPSTKADPGLFQLLKGRPNLNDIDLGNHLTQLVNRAGEINSLTANRRANALLDCLADIENHARQAQWMILRICDKAGHEP